MKKLFKKLEKYLKMPILRTIIISVMVLFLGSLIFGYCVMARVPDCPPGQEYKNGCVWVQHNVTFMCKYLPTQSVAYPWLPVFPEGVCPVQVTTTPTATLAYTQEPATSTPYPSTATSTPVPYSTYTVAPSGTIVATSIPVATSTPIPFITPTLGYCDLCSSVNILLTQSSIQLTNQSVILTRLPRP